MARNLFYVALSTFVSALLVWIFTFSHISKNSCSDDFIPRVSMDNVHSTAEGSAMENMSSCVTGRPCMYKDGVDFRVIVITFNRAKSLLKLLRSVDTMVLDGDQAALEIWIDRKRHINGVDQRTFEVASKFTWNGGKTRVHVQVISLTN